MQPRELCEKAWQEIASHFPNFKVTKKGQNLKKISKNKDLTFEIHFQASRYNYSCSAEFSVHFSIYSKSMIKANINNGFIYGGELESLIDRGRIFRWFPLTGASYQHSVNEIIELLEKYILPICENFEDALNIMKSSPNLTGQDFLSLVVMLEDLYRLFDVLNTYNGRIGGTANVQMSSMQPENTPEQESRHQAAVQTDYLKQFVADIAKRTHKQAQLIVSGFESNPLSDAQWAKLKDIAIQLLRNAVVHGIETPEVRSQRGKLPIGHVHMSLQDQGDKFLLTFEDDGNGVDYAAIAQKAVATGKYTAEEAAKLDKRALISLLFSPGFSTAENSTEDAGRGVGLDIIKDRIVSLGGTVNVASRLHGYTRFSFTLPKLR